MFSALINYALPNIIRVIKSRSVRLVGHVARMGKMKNAYKTVVEKPEGKRPVGRLGTEGKMI
jgi:hypothetical protein